MSFYVKLKFHIAFKTTGALIKTMCTKMFKKLTALGCSNNIAPVSGILKKKMLSYQFSSTKMQGYV